MFTCPTTQFCLVSFVQATAGVYNPQSTAKHGRLHARLIAMQPHLLYYCTPTTTHFRPLMPPIPHALSDLTPAKQLRPQLPL
jgi:hypothetical protein